MDSAFRNIFVPYFLTSLGILTTLVGKVFGMFYAENHGYSTTRGNEFHILILQPYLIKLKINFVLLIFTTRNIRDYHCLQVLETKKVIFHSGIWQTLFLDVSIVDITGNIIFQTAKKIYPSYLLILSYLHQE